MLNEGGGPGAGKVKLFLKFNFFSVFDTLILRIYFVIVRINNIPGDLSNISAEMATL